ncbi:USP36_42 [Mytilus coruscus]|uniref:Ubiquitin carboxyl-terminal hydrolase 36 n=1 Tax=Mytilus coruscus TaxID=42192 RepID=A0A6J8CKA3_MYTCO|nr:USP36_42 [Mytilus coruscus]
MNRILQLHDNCSDDRCFTCKFRDFIEEGPGTAAPLIRQLNTVWHEYRFGKQQDAHEFFVKLMQEVWSTCIETNQDCGVRNIFYGIQKSTVVCDTCVSQAVEEYFAAVPVEYNCLVCNSKDRSAKKMTTLDSIPKNIVIHLKRFNGTLRKVSKKVDVSFDLYLRNHVSNGKELEDKAQLFGVIFHAGRSTSNGHYYAFVKFGQHWFKIDDMKITSITELSLKNCKDQEYILFYRTLPRPYIS